MFQTTGRDSLGWNPWHEDHWRAFESEERGRIPSPFPARVVGEERGLLRLQTGRDEEFWGELTGRLRREAALYPAVGDWVVCSRAPNQPRAAIHRLLPRASCLARVGAGTSGQIQILAANVDVAFIVTSLNGDLNPRRIERYLATVRDGGARPVILLTKLDLCPDPGGAIRDVESVAASARVLAVSALTGDGMEALETDLPPGATAVLLGSSGAGKSTLVNRLIGEERIATRPIRESDDRGRHATTSRRLWALPSGALLIDTPGLRELQLLVDEESLGATFDDVRALSARCRFTDCRHGTEPGGAIRIAIEDGELPEERVAAYDKLRREVAFQERKIDKAKFKEERERWKKIGKQGQAHMRRKRWEA